jgi:hypothetical protein
MAANGQHEAELHASPHSERRSQQTPEAFELVRALIYSLRSSCPKSLKKRLELAGTQLQKFEMRPVWGATPNGYPVDFTIATCPLPWQFWLTTMSARPKWTRTLYLVTRGNVVSNFRLQTSIVVASGLTRESADSTLKWISSLVADAV